MKSSILKKNAIVLFVILIILSPFVFLLLDREYDKEQYFAPQNFSGKDLNAISPDDGSVIQTFVPTAELIVGFDISIVTSETTDLSQLTLVLQDTDGDELAEGIISRDFFSPQGNTLAFRFDPIAVNPGSPLQIQVSSQGSNIQLPIADDDLYPDISLFVEGEQIRGNIAFTPVYRERNVATYTGIIIERIWEQVTR